MPALAPHIASVPESGIRRIFELAVRLDDVIMLAVGEPDVPVAPHIIEAARTAWAEDRTGYTPNGGILTLRHALVEKLARDNGIEVDVEQVWVTIGGAQAIFQALGLVLDAGDAVLVPDPGYTTFTMGARMLQAEPVRYRLRPEHGFVPQLDELEALVAERAAVGGEPDESGRGRIKAIILNSPSNPLGTIHDEALVRELLAFAKRHDLWVISDEVYEAFTYDRPHVTVASLDDDGRVLTVFSLSKSYAMTGVRVGYLVTPPGLVDVMRTVQEGQIGCVAAPDQYAALAAVTGPQDAVVAAAAHYRANLEAAVELLDARGIRHLAPQGAFYLWVDVSYASGGDVAEWARRFLLEQRVAFAPGSAFGPSGEGWIRVCAAASREDLLEGLNRLPEPSRA